MASKSFLISHMSNKPIKAEPVLSKVLTNFIFKLQFHCFFWDLLFVGIINHRKQSFFPSNFYSVLIQILSLTNLSHSDTVSHLFYFKTKCSFMLINKTMLIIVHTHSYFFATSILNIVSMAHINWNFLKFIHLFEENWHYHN